jgi:hypothetical protein
MFTYILYILLQIKENRRAGGLSAGPQSQILEGVTWDEARQCHVGVSAEHIIFTPLPMKLFFIVVCLKKIGSHFEWYRRSSHSSWGSFQRNYSERLPTSRSCLQDPIRQESFRLRLKRRD